MSWKDFFRDWPRDPPRRVNQTMRAGKGSMSIQSGGNISGISQFSSDDVTRMKVNGLDITYDSSAGMVYVKLPGNRKGGVATTTTVNENPLVNLDYDTNKTLVGVEIEVGNE